VPQQLPHIKTGVGNDFPQRPNMWLLVNPSFKTVPVLT